MFEEEEIDEKKEGMIPMLAKGGWKGLEMEMKWSEEDEKGLLRFVEKALEEVVCEKEKEEEEEVMMRVSLNAYDVHRLNGRGDVELMRYEVYKSGMGRYVVMGVGGGAGGKGQFRRLVEKMGGYFQEEEEEEEGCRSSLVASSKELETVDEIRDILGYIKSCYYEHKRCGYKSLLAKLKRRGYECVGKEEEEILEMMKMDIEGSDDLTLLVVLCLKNMRGEKSKEILMERKGMERKEEKKLVFDFGELSRKRAEEIVGEGMVGRYLMYEEDRKEKEKEMTTTKKKKKIIEYHSWSLEGGKHFNEYEVEGEGIEGEEVWEELRRKGMLWYEAVIYKSGMERIIERVMDKMCVI